MSNTIKNPFKGAKFYEERDAKLFFGRSSEGIELFQLIQLYTLVLFYGKSGLGKTSLLQAGIFPTLREENYLPIYIRPDYNDDSADYVLFVKEQFLRVEEDKQLNIDYDHAKTFWENLVAGPIRKKGKGSATVSSDVHVLSERPVIPVLVFDQFEEIFTLGKIKGTNILRKNINQLLQFISEIVENAPPATLSEEQRADLYYDHVHKKMPAKIVFSFKEEYLAQIYTFSNLIPSLLYKNLHYKLNFLSYEKAYEVVNSAADGLFTENACKKILRVVTNSANDVEAEQKDVETFILSVFCEAEFEKVIAKGNVVDADEIDAKKLESLLRTKYLAAIKGYKKKYIDLIENGLITSTGYRIPFYMEEDSTFEDPVTLKLIDNLNTEKIIRYTKHNNRKCIEIVHDKYAQIIKEEKEKRKNKEKTIVIIERICIGAVIVIGILLVYAIVKQEQARVAKALQQVLAERNRSLINDSLSRQQRIQDSLKTQKYSDSLKQAASRLRDSAEEYFRKLTETNSLSDSKAYYIKSLQLLKLERNADEQRLQALYEYQKSLNDSLRDLQMINRNVSQDKTVSKILYDELGRKYQKIVDSLNTFKRKLATDYVMLDTIALKEQLRLHQNWQGQHLGKSKTILWVDDHPESSPNKLLTKVFTDNAAKVLIAKSNFEAYRILENQIIDLIISDVNRDNEKDGGKELLSKCNQTNLIQYVPFVMYSDHLGYRKEALTLGARVLTEKTSEVRDTVLNILNRK